MRKCVLAALCVLLLAGCSSSDDGKTIDLAGQAEDLWGNTIDLNAHADGLCLIQPFSPANCGYCLVDGEFIFRNYMDGEHADQRTVYHQCLFNPQLDVYTYLKHYRESAVPTLTFPPQLHLYHRDGFPFLSAFEDGRNVFAGSLHPYEEKFHEIQAVVAPDRKPALELPGGLFMAEKFFFENGPGLSVYVLAPGDTTGMRRMTEHYRQKPHLVIPVKYENELTDEDLALNLYYYGDAGQFELPQLAADTSPIQLKDNTLIFGRYGFPTGQVSVRACVPNPHHPERFIGLTLTNAEGRITPFWGWVDYLVTGTTTVDGDEYVALLQGNFAKANGNRWTWADSLAHTHESLARFCADGICPSPVSDHAGQRTATKPPPPGPAETNSNGLFWTFGNDCRFPSLAVDSRHACWVAWETSGDIFLAPFHQRRAHVDGSAGFIVEGGPADSFNPVAVWDGQVMWVVYVSERNNFYRLYGRYHNGRRMSPEIPLSDRKPLDVITPAVVGDGQGTLLVTWSEWRANQRVLKYRRVVNRKPQPIETAAIRMPEIQYVNAWYGSVTCTEDGQFWGAWNQHYPATLGVCSGNLVDPARSVTPIHGSIDDNENGGYPDIVIGSDGTRWVVWESFGWDVLSGEPQMIYAASFDETTGDWSAPIDVSDPEQTYFCQTPRIVSDPRDDSGKLWAVWSGRSRTAADGEATDRAPWGIYLATYREGSWSPPRMISSARENARAPQLARTPNGSLWICWHSGIGSDMHIKVMCIDDV